MFSRIKNLRDISVDTRPSISLERARLITEFYRSQDMSALSAPMQRALAFRYLMERKEIYIGKDELIVGERGPAPRETPTFPEICCHDVQDLRTLNSRDRVAYDVSEQDIALQKEEIIPFWRGKTIREKIFQEMTDEWLAAYEAGIFTEFMEQRAPGHTALDDKIYKFGYNGFKRQVRERLNALENSDEKDADGKREQLKAMEICADALIRYGARYARSARELAQHEGDPQRKKELLEIAAVCERVPAEPPRTFREALQMYWFTHVGVISELNTWDAISPGRFDQHLYPFYSKDLKDGLMTQEEARELLQCIWIKFNNQPAPPKVGVTAEESGTYNDFALISLGGQKTDGSDGVNELSYLMLEVLEELKMVQPHCCIQLSRVNPDPFIRRAVEVNRIGFGQPSVFNHDAVVQELIRQGKSISDARDGGTSGCVETGAFGKENYNLTGYFNIPKVLEIALNNGVDPVSGKRIGIETGEITSFQSFDQLYAAFKKQLVYFTEVKIRGNDVIERIYAEYMPTPFLSLLISDCISEGRDYHAGGARYNSSYIQGVGLGSITDSLSAIKHAVFDHKVYDLEFLMNMLRSNFDGYDKERAYLVNKVPKYGNDDDQADDIMRMVFDTYFSAIDGRKNAKGGTYRINLLPTTVHVYFGSCTGATPDGRKAGEPFSEGVSPVQGADRNGPTAVINSVGKIDHIRTGGTLLNQKFTPDILKDRTGVDNLSHLVRTYFTMNGHHIQFNVVTAETLKKAQRYPDQYRDLIVRVAGYSDYFCNLNEGLQNEIIARTEHDSFGGHR